MAKRSGKTRKRAAAPVRPQRGRIKRLRAAIAAEGLTHLLVTNPNDVAYLTGFLGGDSYLLVNADQVGAGRKPVVISDFRYQEELEAVGDVARVYIRPKSMSRAVADVLTDEGVERVGVQAEHMTLAQRRSVAEGVGARRIVETNGLVGRMRAVKDEHEIRLIRKAARLQERALEAVLETIEPGQTELQVAAALEAEMKSRGSSRPGFPTIVASGATGSLPHYRPGRRKVARNRPLLIDWGAVVDGYHADMTRCFVWGRWPAKLREIYRIVLDAHEMAADALAPGAVSTDVDAVARRHIADSGFEAYFGHGLGHGMGLDGHESPALSPAARPTVLEEGMVVTVEPGIYLPGVGGVRIEDDYVITARGARNLCSMPRQLDWATR